MVSHTNLKNGSIQPHIQIPVIINVQHTTFTRDDSEEGIYSEGEEFEGELYPDNTWDSDDNLYEKEPLLTSEWI